jgi:hypothetical protein
VIVRADLPQGVRSAQIIHAAGESSPGWLPNGTYAVALWRADERSLQREIERLQSRGFRCLRPSFWMRVKLLARELLRIVWPRGPIDELAFVPIYEPDPPYHGSLMAIGVVPARKEALRRHLSSIPTVK